jgi:DNA modification methylase
MNYQLFCGDCIEIMKSFPDNYINLTVTSPPYDDLRTYNRYNYQKYSFEFERIAHELRRITKPGGVIVWIVGDATKQGSETATSLRQALYFKEVLGLNLHDTMIYHKDSCPFPETTRYYPSFEYMFVFSKGTPKTVNLIADKPNKQFGKGKKVASSTQREKDGTTRKVSASKTNPEKGIKEFGVRQNVWSYSPGYMKTTKDKEAYKHPAMFPEQLANDHIISWSNPGDLVFDPFVGSGTTGKMAILNNRNFIGCDISAEYIEIAKKRIEDHYIVIREAAVTKE